MARKKKEPVATAELEVVRATVIEPARTEAEGMLRTVAELDLSAPERREWVGQVLTAAAQGLEILEKQRKSMTGPLLESKRNIDAHFDPAKDQLQALIKCCKERLSEVAAETRATQMLALEAVAGGARDAQTLAAAHAAVELPAGTRERVRLGVRVKNLAEVPPSFLQLNEKLALEYANTHGGVACTLAGLEFFEIVDVVRTGGAT
jgi:hypothetical protein